MNILVTGKRGLVTSALRTHAQGAFKKIFDHKETVTSIRVTCATDASPKTPNRVTVTAKVGHKKEPFVIKTKGADMYTTLTEAARLLHEKIMRTKGKTHPKTKEVKNYDNIRKGRPPTPSRHDAARKREVLFATV